jgi:hypothetical protein
MATNYPTSLDTFYNPAANDDTSAVDHAGIHTHANDAISALQVKVGVNNSNDTNSLDYKVNKIIGNCTVDTGKIPCKVATKTFSDNRVVTTSHIMANTAFTSDEAEFNDIRVNAYCATNGVITFVLTSDLFFNGVIPINYIIGN